GCAAAGGADQSQEHAHRGRLARAVRPQEPEDFPRVDVELQVEHAATLTKVLGQPADLDDAGDRGFALGSRRHSFSPAEAVRTRRFVRSCTATPARPPRYVGTGPGRAGPSPTWE